MSIDLTKYDTRTDLILEEIKASDGIVTDILNPFPHTKITKVSILNDMYNKKKGEYYTIETSALESHDHDLLQELEGCVIDCLKDIIKKNNLFLNHNALVVGLGNSLVTPDALGPSVLEDILVTRHLFLLEEPVGEGFRNVSSIAPGVMGQTGMETKDIILGVIRETKPDFVIAIDALASKSMDHLCKSIQITDAGINPGSGIGNNRSEMSFETLGIPVIAIGVPTVLDVVSIGSDSLEFILKSFQQEIMGGNPLVIKSKEEKDYDDISLPSMKMREKVMGDIGLLDNNQKRMLLHEALGTNYNLFVCPKEIDVYLNDLRHLLAQAINTALSPSYNRQN